jgi:hypothetical protein
MVGLSGVQIHACKDFSLLKVDFCGAKWILEVVDVLIMGQSIIFNLFHKF